MRKLTLHRLKPTGDHAVRPHPLSNPSEESRLDILAGGTIDGVMRETLVILRQSVKQLAEGESAMVLNSLVSERQMESALGRWFDPDEVLNATYSPDRVLEKFEFLERVIEERNVRLIIVTSFEFSAVMPGARLQLMRFLKRLLMEKNIRVVVMLRSVPRQTSDGTFVSAGPVGLLAFMARTIQDIGWYRQQPMTAADFLDEAFVAPMSQEEAEDLELAEHHADRLAAKVLAQAPSHQSDSQQKLGRKPSRLLKNEGQALKNKELAMAA